MSLRAHFLVFAWLALLSTGCGVFAPATRNFLYTTAECVDKVCVWDRNRTLARTAWKQIEKEEPPGTYSEDYARGFLDGYADYLKGGGPGDPPTTPPHCYWFSKYQTPTGYQAIQDWFAGFQRGAAEAQGSGLRQWITLPVVGTLPQDVRSPTPTPTPTAPPVPSLENPPGPGEPLPMPRKVIAPPDAPRESPLPPEAERGTLPRDTKGGVKEPNQDLPPPPSGPVPPSTRPPGEADARKERDWVLLPLPKGTPPAELPGTSNPARTPLSETKADTILLPPLSRER